MGLGCMRLSTDPARDEAVAVATLHAALDAGVDLLDTADVYAQGADDLGHNERMVARALATWPGDRTRVTIASKGGLTRPDGGWLPEGRARHLRAACEASVRALGVEAIDLYQLHAPDPRTELSTSVRALAALQREGVVRRVGLCNVTVAQAEQARRIVEVAAVQVALGAFDDGALRSGILEYCAARGIRCSRTPLGGAQGARRLARDATLAAVALRRGATPAEVALAWLRSLHPLVVALPGATRVETARSLARADALELDADDLRALDARLPAVSGWRARVAGGAARPAREAVTAAIAPTVDTRVPTNEHSADTSAPAAATTPADAAEVVVIMGYPAAGKSTAVEAYVARGYLRLNRDERGGRLIGIADALEKALRAGGRRFVLDNTYPSRRSRNPVIDAAARHRVPVRCVWLTTTLEQAQVNACARLVDRYAGLPMPEALPALARSDPNAFAPGAQFRYRRELEPPGIAEGFAEVEHVPFVPRARPDRARRALIVDVDGVLWRSTRGARAPSEPGDVALDEGAAGQLRRLSARGWLLLGTSWQPEIAAGRATQEGVAAAAARAAELLGARIDIVWCPHGPGPPVCWCRKPLPGLGVLLVARHGVDVRESLHVGKGPHDRLFAERLGLQYADHWL
ncbi:MAG: aldo/keto reductase [Polyangiaceae bacterium]